MNNYSENHPQCWVPVEHFKEVCDALETALQLATVNCQEEKEDYEKAKAVLERASAVRGQTPSFTPKTK